MANVREANINAVGNWRMPVLENLADAPTSLEKVGEAVKEMKSGSPRLDGFFRYNFKKRWYGIVGWLVRLLNISFDMGVVPMDWRGAFIVPLYKGKGEKCECSNSRGISLLSEVD